MSSGSGAVCPEHETGAPPEILAHSAPGGRAAPDETADLTTGSGEGNKVFLFNCSCHTFEQVITQLIKAIRGMTRPLAEELAWRVHTNGLAEVFRGDPAECDRVAAILKDIGLIVEVW
jgi:ATP-dependent Clp protease adaptor protein ClpS